MLFYTLFTTKTSPCLRQEEHSRQDNFIDSAFVQSCVELFETVSVCRTRASKART